MKQTWKVRIVSLLFFGGLLATYAWSDTIELVTFYPTTSDIDNLEVSTLSVGNSYRGTNLLDGEAIIFDRLGIGRDDPEEALDVVGSIRVDSATVTESPVLLSGTTDGFRINFGTGTGLTNNPLNDFLIFEKIDGNNPNPDGGIAFTNTGNDNVEELSLVIRGDGRVGIGTADPTRGQLVVASPFEAIGTGNGQIAALSTDPWQQNRGGRLVLGGPISDADLRRTFAGIAGLKENATENNRRGYLALYTRSDIPGVNVDLTERMRITSFGNVGIGTAAPATTSPTNNVATGNLDVNDVFLRSAGQWASQITPAIEIAQAFRRDGPANNRPLVVVQAPAGSNPFVLLDDVSAHPDSRLSGSTTLDGLQCNTAEGWRITGAWIVVNGSDSDILPFDNGAVTDDFDQHPDVELSIVCVRTQ